MLCKAKTESGTWIYGFLIGYYNTVERESVESYAVFEGIKDVDAIKVKQETICEFVCKDMNGKDAFIGDIIELKQENRRVHCLLVKESNGMFSIYPNYSEGSLWRLNIIDGVGNFFVIGNRYDDKDQMEWLKMKELWFKRRLENK